jgi:hypothetical protein
MPNNIIKSFSDKTGKTEKEIETYWNKAKKISIDKGYTETDDDFYAYTVGVLKQMLGINESDGQAATSVSSTGLGGPVPASGSGNAITHVKVGEKPLKNKKKKLITFKEYINKHIDV